jgi:endo-1,4-beta-mannosidase
MCTSQQDCCLYKNNRRPISSGTEDENSSTPQEITTDIIRQVKANEVNAQTLIKFRQNWSKQKAYSDQKTYCLSGIKKNWQSNGKDLML